MSKLVINTKKFRSELAFVNSTIISNPTNAQYTFVLLEVSDKETLVLMGTNGTNAARTSLKLETPLTEEVSIALPADKLLELVRLFTTETFTISIGEKKTTLSDGKGRYAFSHAVQAAAHIKPLATQEITSNEPTVCEMAAKAFLDVLNFAESFIAKEDNTKFVLSGVKIEADASGLNARAMDGHRAIDITVADPVEGRQDTMFIHKSGIKLLASMSENIEKVVTVKSDACMCFTGGPRVAYLRRRATENTPAIAQFLSNFLTQNTIKATVNAPDVLDAVKKLAIAAEGKFKKIKFTVDDAVLKLSSRDSMADVSEFDADIPATTEGKGDFFLNSEYVIELLRYVTGPIVFHAGPSINPAVVTNDHGLRCMISQMTK